MKREFKKGEDIFVYNYLEPDLNGFGVVLKDTIAEDDSDVVYLRVNLSGEVEETANNIYKIAVNRICNKCGGVVCHEHGHTLWDYPYYCPRCNENLFEIETELMQERDFNLRFLKSVISLLPKESL